MYHKKPIQTNEMQRKRARSIFYFIHHMTSRLGVK